MSRGVVRSKNLIAKRRKRNIFLSVVFVIFFVLFIAGFFYLIHLPFFRIQNIDVSNISSVKIDEVNKIVRDDIAGSYFFVIPKDSIFFYSKKSIEKDILKMSQRIESVEIKTKYFKKIEIKIGEYEPTALWCQKKLDNVVVSTSSLPVLFPHVEKCLFLDKNGYVFSQAPTFSDSVYIKYFSQKDIAVGESFLPQEEFRSLNYFIKNLIELGFEVFSVSDQGDKNFIANTVPKTEIYFSLRSPLEKVIESIVAFLNNKELFPKGTQSLRELSFLDVRSYQKILFKFKSN